MPRLGGGRGAESDDERCIGRRRTGPARPAAIVNVRSASAVSAASGQLRLRCLRVELGIAAGRPIPKPGIAALPHASGRVGLEDAGGPRGGEVGGDLGVRVEVGAVGESADAGSASWSNGIARPMTVTTSPGSIRASW